MDPLLELELDGVVRLESSKKSGDGNADQNPGVMDLAGEALHSAAYSALQGPLTGVAQLVDKAAGTDLAESTSFLRAPDEVTDTYSSRWHTHHVASAVGMILPFMLARGGARKILKPQNLANSGLGWKGYAVAEGALSGFIYDSAMHPVDANSENFWGDRLKNGLTGAATFGTLTASGIGIRENARGLIGNTGLTRVLESPVGAATLSGVPAGLVSAQTSSLLFEGKPASFSDSVESAYAMSFVGFALSSAHQSPLTKNHVEGKDPVSRTISNFKTTAGQKFEQGSLFIESKARGGVRNLDQALTDLLMPDARLQPAFAMAGSGRPAGSLVLNMESFRPEAKSTITEALPEGRSHANENTGPRERAGGPESRVKPEADVIDLADVKAAKLPEGRKSEGQVLETERAGKEAPRESELASEVVYQTNHTDIAEYIAHSKDFRGLKADPSKVFYGNDALFVIEVLPTKKLPDGAVLKAIVPEGGWETEWGKRPGDARLLSKVHEVDIGSGVTAYLFLQELVDVRTRYENHLLDDYFRGLEGKDLAFEEPGTNPNKQFGISQVDGRLVLIDYPSTGKPGHMQTLTELTQGADYFEAQFDRENESRMGRGRESEPEIKEQEADIRDWERQKFKDNQELTETDREIIDQLSLGISKGELADYMALMEGKVTESGEPNRAEVMPRIEALIERAKSDGLDLDID